MVEIKGEGEGKNKLRSWNSQQKKIVVLITVFSIKKKTKFAKKVNKKRKLVEQQLMTEYPYYRNETVIETANNLNDSHLFHQKSRVHGFGCAFRKFVIKNQLIAFYSDFETLIKNLLREFIFHFAEF